MPLKLNGISPYGAADQAQTIPTPAVMILMMLRGFAMKKRLEYKDGKAEKFWEGEVVDYPHTIKYRKIGTNGHESTTEFSTEDEAVKNLKKW